MLLVGGEPRPASIWRRQLRQSRGSTAPARADGSGGSPPAAAARSHEQAIRQGSRIAAAPPGQRHRPQVADALEAAQVAEQELAAPDRAVGAVAGAVEDRARRPAPVSPCSARQAARCAWWCWTPISSTPSRSSAYFVER